MHGLLQLEQAAFYILLVGYVVPLSCCTEEVVLSQPFEQSVSPYYDVVLCEHFRELTDKAAVLASEYCVGERDLRCLFCDLGLKLRPPFLLYLELCGELDEEVG